MGNSYSVMYSRKLQGQESSKYILLFTAQTVLLKEARPACALLLALEWYKEFSFLSEVQREGSLVRNSSFFCPIKAGFTTGISIIMK